jgi:hypothetical protein
MGNKRTGPEVHFVIEDRHEENVALKIAAQSFEKLALAVLYNYSTTRGHLSHQNPTVWATLSEVAILLSLWACLSMRQACLLLELINLLCLVLTIHHSQGREAFACL